MINKLFVNVVANYIGQVYIAIVGIAVVPIYLSKLGSEGFGLVSFFTLLQSLLVVLDLGISSTLSREVAILKSKAGYLPVFKKILKFVIIAFLIVAVLIIGSINFSKEIIATKWLNTSGTNLFLVEYSLSIIGVIIALRWCAGPFKSVILGCEEQIKFNIINTIVATLRFVIVIPVMSFYGNNVKVFFTYQLLAAIIEFVLFLLLSIFCFKKIEKEVKEDTHSSFTHEFYSEIKRVGKFSCGIALTSAAWIAISQSDKIILSKFLTISDYGMFSVAATIAGGILILSTPISQAILPRMSSLYSDGDLDGLYNVYSLASKGVISLLAPISLVMAANSELVLSVWTGNNVIATHSADVLTCYALGNLFFAIAAFPYYLQYAFGQIRLHVYGNIFFIIIIIPSLILSIKTFGAIGAGYVWLIQNAIFLILWSWFIHGRFIRSKRIAWLISDVLVTLIPTILIIIIFKIIYLSEEHGRMFSFFILASQSVIAFLSTILADTRVRKIIKIKIIKRKYEI